MSARIDDRRAALLPLRGRALTRIGVLALALAGCTPQAPPPTPAGADATLDQGWTWADRVTFQTTPQGSYLIPLAWFRALRQPGGEAFGADQLGRYGYLSSAGTLPVGFVAHGDPANPTLGITCAACHTGRLTWRGQAWRIDGGRANADFQSFLADLGQAAQTTLADPVRFDAFAHGVLGAAAPPQSAQLRQDFAAWTASYTDFMAHSLPRTPWGPGRLDAFGMIFNRATALDLGLAANYAPADAPVRYPFLWDAPRQDRTQWTGAAPNGTYLRALARNTGEVLGVFGRFHPVNSGIGGVVYCNAIDRTGLQALEEGLVRLRAPKWPAVFPLDPVKAARGGPLFGQHCASCHGIRLSGEVANAWETPIRQAGTDPRAFDNAARTGLSGALAGSQQPPLLGPRLLPTANKTDILANEVTGTILDDAALRLPIGCPADLASRHDHAVTRAIALDIAENRLPLDRPPSATPKAAVARASAQLFRANGDQPQAAYEARVLTGIWTAGPYLHNGSVATLWELLQPPAQRMPRFPAGVEEFDPVHVGPDTTRPGRATFIADPAAGNSNQGHEWGTTLPESDRWDLLEYLKTL